MKGNLSESILGQLSVTSDNVVAAVPWRSFSKRKWDHALDWLDYSGLAIHFLLRVESSNSANVLPEDVKAELERRRAGNQRRTAAILGEFGDLIQSFTGAGVKYAVLKGVALLPDYCPDPEFRTQYDHDVLVDPRSLENAERVLRRAGYERKNSRDDDHTVVYRRPEPQVRFPRTSEGLYSPDLPRSIELHLKLWEDREERIHVNLPEDFLERAQSRQWGGMTFTALSDEDCLLFQILHAFKHILRNWCRLLIFLEIATFLKLRSADSQFWRRFVARVAPVRWAPEATFVVFTLAAELFGAPIPAELQTAINSRRSPALKLWIERYGRRAALANFHADKCSLFLHEEFVESRGEWTAIRRRRLFPIQRPHRPPAVVFQRGFSGVGRLWLENLHAIRRLRHHALAGLAYSLEYPRWLLLRRLRLAGSA